MSPATTDAQGMANLQSRAIAILSRPKEEWPVIAAEPADVASLYRGYIMPLAAIPPIAGFIGMTIIGVTVPFFGTYRYGFGSGITAAIVQYVLSLAAVYIAALVIDKLAPTFKSTPNQIQSLKLVAYASTAGWVAGVLRVIPALGILAVLGSLYGIYLFYTGVQPTMKTPSDKVIPYMVVSAIVIIVISVVFAMVATALTAGMIAGPRIGI